ncbi:pyrroloquinoline quinone biosynthesis peptide chaperone PqqD [Balneatrix alpica]|uniref:PqqA binding protein n=1 Tax=Balneatrix alpica TaxID=75684 RepID=A0ABV5ZFL5_9GAMM|nr:pyrroloquinoline quinone biosynthesis peptide chaperone PqqD [Balneatrix alpica]
MNAELYQVPQLNSLFRLQWEPAQQAHVLLYPEGMVKLNASAGAILALVDGQACLAEIIALLQHQFPEANGLSEDVLHFIQIAQQQNWLRLQAPS